MNEKEIVKFIITNKDARIPTKATRNSACYDLYSIEDFLVLDPGSVVKVPIGLKMQMPPNIEAQIRSRSGLSLKGITVANSPGTIDSDYRGELMVLLRNDTKNSYIIEKGDRIAQMKFSYVLNVDFEWRTELDKTDRSDGGFGSTGR